MSKNNKFDTSMISSLFNDNINLILDEMNEADSLYEELKEHFNCIKKSSSPGALTFISKQTPNLISLKSNKIQLIEKLTNIQKIAIDATIKLRDENDIDANNNAILKALHKMLITNDRTEYIKEVESNDDNVDESNMSNLLDNRLKEIKKDKKENNKSSNKKELIINKDYFIVVDEDSNLYAVDDEYNILENSDELIPTDWYIEFIYNDDNEIEKAINQYNDEIEIICMDDEE